MPAIKIDSCYLKEILEKLNDLPPHNWLISGLECYDYCGWEGCRKWAQENLFLTDKELKRDVDLRNMQIIWGIFSAVPASCGKEQLEAFGLPDVESTRYMADHIVPQHPKAMLEIYVVDGSYMIVSAADGKLLEPLYDLTDFIGDEEASNQEMNRNLRRIRRVIRKVAPKADSRQINEIQWRCWHLLFRGTTKSVTDMELCTAIEMLYDKIQQSGARYYYTQWDPDAQQ